MDNSFIVVEAPSAMPYTEKFINITDNSAGVAPNSVIDSDDEIVDESVKDVNKIKPNEEGVIVNETNDTK